MAMTIPVIILSTLTGTASVGLNGLVGDDPDTQKYAQVGIGVVSLIAGILTTLGNFLRYAQLSEANRVAGISWGKFQRQIAVELSLHPNDRLDSMDFIKICRAELDRLIEQSPAIPDDIINMFLREFKDLPELKRPDICKGIEHTEAFKDKSSRLTKLAGEAALMLQHKKKVLREELLPDIDNRLTRIMERKIEELRSELQSQMVIPVGQEQNRNLSAPIIPIKKSLSAYEPDWKRLVSKNASRANTIDTNDLMAGLPLLNRNRPQTAPQPSNTVIDLSASYVVPKEM